MSESASDAAADPLPQRFLFNTNFVFVSTLVSNTTGFFVAVLLARALGPEGRGEAAIFQTAVGFAYAFFNLGIAQAAFYFVSRGEMGRRRASEAGLTVTVAAAGATAVGVLVARLLFNDWLADKDIPYGLSIALVPALIQYRMVLALLRAQGRFGAMNLLELTLPLTVLVSFVAVELTVGLTVSRAVWVWSIVNLPVLAIGYALLGFEFMPLWPAPASDLVRSVKFGLQAHATNLVQLVNYRIDIVMILLLLDTEGVGIYTIATSQSEGLWIVASAAIVLLTHITGGDDEASARLTPVVCRNTLLVTGVAAIGAAIIAALWIPLVFGADYQPSVVPYLLLLPGTVAQAGSAILAAYVFSRGRPIINAWIGLVVLGATIPTNLGLIQLLGVPGAAISTSIGYTLDLWLTAWAYRTLSGGSWREALLPRRSDVGIYTGALRTGWRWVTRRAAPAAV